MNAPGGRRSGANYDAVVVGGGVVGLSIAYHLSSSSDLKVAVLDRGDFGRGATWAAAGMLAVQCEIDEAGPFLELGVFARSLYDRLNRELFEETGVDIEHRRTGILRVALDPEERVRLIEQVERQRSWGLEAEWLEPRDVRRLEPLLTPSVCGGALLPGDGCVNNRRLVEALTAACARRGVHLLDHVEAVGLVTRPGGEVLGVATAIGELHAPAVVLAAGAWSGTLASQLGVDLPVFPVKGEILALQGHGDALRHIVFAKGTCYLVPRPGGRLLAGATQVEAGFNDAPTLGGLLALAKGATTLVPSLGAIQVAEGWGGLRPGTPDGKPVLGPVPGRRGLYVAAGHFRHGILLGPASGLALAKMILGEPVPFAWSPFSIERFR